MIKQNSAGWARNVFMALLLVGGLTLVQSAAQAAEGASSTDMVATTTSSLVFDMTPMLVTLTTTTSSTIPSLAIAEQNFVTRIGQALQAELHVSGGTAPYQWTLISSGLPEGVFFDTSSGRLLGAPIRNGQFPFTVQATDAMGVSVTKSLTLRVTLAGETVVDPLATNAPVTIDLEHITDDQLKILVDTFVDDSPLLYVGPNAPVSILKVNIAQMRIKPNGLYRVEGGTASTVNEAHKYSDVYYVDPNGRRHAFSTEAVFKSWYKDEPQIDAVPDWKISNIPLRQNVTFRPGTVVRLENTQEFYRVMPGRTLKKFQDEATYQRLAPSLMNTTSSAALELVPVLPLAQVANYQMDTMTIKVLSDLPTIANTKVYPVDEMGE